MGTNRVTSLLSSCRRALGKVVEISKKGEGKEAKQREEERKKPRHGSWGEVFANKLGPPQSEEDLQPLKDLAPGLRDGVFQLPLVGRIFLCTGERIRCGGRRAWRHKNEEKKKQTNDQKKKKLCKTTEHRRTPCPSTLAHKKREKTTPLGTLHIAQGGGTDEMSEQGKENKETSPASSPSKR